MVGSHWSMKNGQFEKINSLGAGATAEVFKARNLEADRLVALKCFLSFVSQDPESLKRLKDEIQILKTFDHPNVVKLFGEHMVNSRLCLELELVEGCDLREWIRDKRSHLLETDLWILVQVARGLGAVHEKGFIHRDLKPENVLISNQGEIKLSDFGLAKELNRLTMTKLGLLVGSLGYMAPEATEGQKSCIKSDIFSFGAIAYELLSGHPPIQGETAQAIIKKAMEPVTPLNQIAPHIPPRIANLIDQCLELKKENRPESIWAIESEIMGYINSTGLLPLCQKLIVEDRNTGLYKEALKQKQIFLEAQANDILREKRPDRKKMLSLINEYQRLFPEDPKTMELISALRNKKKMVAPHPILWAPLVLVFFSLSVFFLVDFRNFGEESAKASPKLMKEGVVPAAIGATTETSVPPEKTVSQKNDENLSVADKDDGKSKTKNQSDTKAKEPVTLLKKETAKKTEPVKPKPKSSSNAKVAKVKKPKPKKAKRKALVPKPELGVLSFEVDDDVEIFVDGEKVKTSELEAFKVKPGTHKVKMVKEGYLPIENEIFVKKDKTTTIRAKGVL